MSGPVDLYLNDVLMRDDEGVEWSWNTREVLGGVGSATFVVQDRTNSIQPEPHDDVKLVRPSTGWVLFRGEVDTVSLDLPDMFPWRKWSLNCSDYNNQFSQRLVGAFDGKTWIDSSGLGIFVNIDPFSSTLQTDKLTVQTWLDNYLRVRGDALETETFVTQYLDDVFPQDFDYADLQQALEKLASLVAANLQFWADPDLFFHWVTIPAWQDLLPDILAVAADDTESLSAMMFPESPETDLDDAPFRITDTVESETDVALSSLRIDYDGNKMPEQVYVKGATGYVYNSPPISALEETKTVVHSPTAGEDARYELTFLTTTKVWHVDGTGYVSIFYDLASAGGPYPVKWVSVAWNEDRHKGGNYWKLLDGPYEGKLADDNTNYLSGYGSIRVDKIVASTAGDPVVGIGGSGWTNEALQDKSKRQVYLESAISGTVAQRNSIGGQAEYRGRYPTLRGSVKVRDDDDGTARDGWRVGQVVEIADARLPDELNGLSFVIQEVATRPVSAGSDVLEYQLGFGDGPESRYSAERNPGDVAWPPPFIQLEISVFDLAPGPNSTQTITAQLINGSGGPWALPGKVVNWSFECYDSLGILQSGQGSLSRTVSVTDKTGKARTRLTTGPGTALVYYVFAEVKAI